MKSTARAAQNYSDARAQPGDARRPAAGASAGPEAARTQPCEGGDGGGGGGGSGGMKTMFESVTEGDVGAVEKALEAHPEKLDKALTEAGDTPLTWALNPNSGMRTEVAEALVKRGAKVDAQQNDGWTPLMLACRYGQPGIAKMLVEHGAKLDLQKKDGWTALMIACRHEQPEIAQLLVERGADLGLQNQGGWNALMLACEHDQSKTAQDMIKRGAALDTQQNDGWTALMFAARHDQPATVKMLIEKGADLNLEDADGVTALMHACRKPLAPTHTCEGLLEAVKALWAAGANLESGIPKLTDPLKSATRAAPAEAAEENPAPASEGAEASPKTPSAKPAENGENHAPDGNRSTQDAGSVAASAEPASKAAGAEPPSSTPKTLARASSTASSAFQTALAVAKEEGRTDAVEFLRFVYKSEVVKVLLGELGLSRQVALAFYDNEVRSMEDCAMLTETDLHEMGVDTVMKRRKVLRRFQPPEQTAPESPPEAPAARPDTSADFAARLDQAQKQQQQEQPPEVPQCSIQ